MKKTYINPNIEIIKIATQQMIAGSGSDRSITSTDAGKGEGGVYDDAHFDEFDW